MIKPYVLENHDLQKDLDDCYKELKEAQHDSLPSPEPEPESRSDGVTRGWIVFKDCDCLGGQNARPKTKLKRSPKGTSIRHVAIDNGFGGYATRHGSHWFRSASTDELISNMNKNWPDAISNHDEVHIAPGASLALVRQKRAEGFDIQFDDGADELDSRPLSGSLKKKKKKKKKSKKKKSKKKKRKSKKTKKRKNK